MNDIIDNELARRSSLDLPIILRWMLVGVLGCIVFENLESLIQSILITFIEFQSGFSGYTSFLLSELIVVALMLIIFYNVIQSFKKRYKENKTNIRKILIRLVVLYVLIKLSQLATPLIDGYLYRYSSETGTDPLSNEYLLIKIFFIAETFLKYGLASWILLRKQ